MSSNRLRIKIRSVNFYFHTLVKYFRLLQRVYMQRWQSKANRSSSVRFGGWVAKRNGKFSKTSCIMSFQDGDDQSLWISSSAIYESFCCP